MWHRATENRQKLEIPPLSDLLYLCQAVSPHEFMSSCKMYEILSVLPTAFVHVQNHRNGKLFAVPFWQPHFLLLPFTVLGLSTCIMAPESNFQSQQYCIPGIVFATPVAFGPEMGKPVWLCNSPQEFQINVQHLRARYTFQAPFFFEFDLELHLAC